MIGCPVEDDNVGILYYRDCIFADCVQQQGSILKLKGEINGSHASKVQEKIWLPYELIFKNVIKYSSCELDTYEADANAFHRTEKDDKTDGLSFKLQVCKSF